MKFNDNKNIDAYIYKGLNAEQKEAVETLEGFVEVISGAGSGKTKTLVDRYLNLAVKEGVSPDGILCCTFTNKAASEMKSRIRKLVGDNDLSSICTIHGWCNKLLKEDGHVIHYPSNFMILDNDDIDLILAEVFTTLGITGREYSFDKAKAFISKAKSPIRSPKLYEMYCKVMSAPNMDYLLKLREEYKELEIDEPGKKTRFSPVRLFFEYLYLCKKNYGMDFDDLILMACYILENDEEVRKKWQHRLHYIMIDEYQDVSTRQAELIYLLSEEHNNLFVVGDPDQNIYSWRGADVMNILEFESRTPVGVPFTKVVMEKNYRSSPEILNVANAVIKNNLMRFNKDLVPVIKEQGKAVYYHAKSNTEEANWIVDKMIELHDQKEIPYSDMAVLYRGHSLSRPIEEAMIRKAVPYTVWNGMDFYSRKEIKNTLAYLRHIALKDNLSFLRIANTPRRGLGKVKIDKIVSYADTHNLSYFESLRELYNLGEITGAKVGKFIWMVDKYHNEHTTMPLSDLVHLVLNASGYEEHLRTIGDMDRLANIEELRESIKTYEKVQDEKVTLVDYLNYIQIFCGEDGARKDKGVKLMTIHASKGLEFEVVFIPGFNEGVIPSSKAGVITDLEEERRLAYVAFTRAKRELYVTDAEGFTDQKSFRYPSRFIFEAGDTLEYVNELPEELVQKALTRIDMSDRRMDNKANINKGDRVKHPNKQWGKGTVVDVIPEKEKFIILFDNGLERELTFSAPLKKLKK